MGSRWAHAFWLSTISAQDYWNTPRLHFLCSRGAKALDLDQPTLGPGRGRSPCLPFAGMSIVYFPLMVSKGDPSLLDIFLFFPRDLSKGKLGYGIPFNHWNFHLFMIPCSMHVQVSPRVRSFAACAIDCFPPLDWT